jgi:anti-sigma regulatory factor (Ser/Thr protein kinase)
MDDSRRFSAFAAKGSDPLVILAKAERYTSSFLAQSSLDQQSGTKLIIIVEELVANVLRHGGKANDLTLHLKLGASDAGMLLEIEDDGPAFDPTTDFTFTGPDVAEGGSVGLEIVRSWGCEISYFRDDRRNRFCLTIK